MPVRAGRLARLARLGGMAASVAGRAAGAAGLGGEAGQTLHAEAARRLGEALGEMKGLPQKAGQILSMLDEVLPAEVRATYAEVLGRLQSQAPPLPWAELVPQVEADLGAPLDRLFLQVDPVPAAAASIGQVHRATLPDGREVAIKVQYPGVAQALRGDLQNVDALVGALASVLPRASIEHMLRDITVTFEQELDFLHEAAAGRRFAARWAGDPALRFPEVVAAGPRVLVATWLPGDDLDAAIAAPAPLRAAWAGALWRFTWTSVLRHRCVHGDPHPGNFRFRSDGSLGVLDFGATADLPAPLAQGLAALAQADPGRLSDAALLDLLLPALGMPRDLHPEVAAAWADFSRRLMAPMAAPQPHHLRREDLRALIDAVQAAKLAMARRALWQGVPTPATRGVPLLMRTMVGQAALLARLDVPVDYRAATG